MKMHAVRAFAVLFLLAAALPADAETPAASLPRWEGVWIAENHESEVSGRLTIEDAGGKPVTEVYPLAGFTAPWNEAGWAKFETMLMGAPSGKAAGWGYPMMMQGSAPLQFVISPSETLIVNLYREVRFIRTDGRPHPAPEDRWPTTWGDSIGHWEGDTLVVDTVGVKDPTDFFYFAPPLSEDARYVERLRLVAPGRIESEITIEDPATLSEPWHVKQAYLRTDGMDRIVYEPLENDRTGFDGEFATIEKQATPKPKPAAASRGPAEIRLTAAELDRVTGRYELGPGNIMTVRRLGNTLLAGSTGQPMIPIHASSPLTFSPRVIDMKFRFTADAAGQIAGVEFAPPGAPPGTPPIIGKRLP